MKAPQNPHGLVQTGLGVLLAWLATGASLAAERQPVATRPDAPTTHVLFVGVDLAAEKNRVYHPVVDVTGTSLVIAPDGKPVKLPLSTAANLRIIEELKLTDRSVGLDQFKFERAYSAGADPTAELAKMAALSAGQQTAVDFANAAERAAAVQVAGAGGMVASAGNPEDMANARAAMNRALEGQAAASADLDRALSTSNNQVFDVSSQSTRLGEEAYDAVRISFVVTPETDLAQPYYGVIAQIRDPESRPGHGRKWIYVESLGPLAAGESRRVLVYQSGFPPGFSLEGCEVHVYDGQAELATNLSRRRVALTDEEAFAYRVIEYIGDNRESTLPATLATAAVDAGVVASLSRYQLDETWHVRVSRDGYVTAVFRDAAGKKPLQDAALVAALKTLQFNPALEAGKPVESLAPVVLGRVPVR